MAYIYQYGNYEGGTPRVEVTNGNQVYMATLTEFETDYGEAFPSLPDGAEFREYVAGIKHKTFSNSGTLVSDEPTNWGEGDTIIAALSSLITAKNERENPSPQTLEEHKNLAKHIIDGTAEQTRLRYITFGSGQTLVYQEKAEEANTYKLAGYPAFGSPNEYPFVAADAAAYSITPQEAADQILTLKATWIAVGSQIEQIRLTGKNGVNAAVDESGITTAMDNTVSQLEAI